MLLEELRQSIASMTSSRFVWGNDAWTMEPKCTANERLDIDICKTRKTGYTWNRNSNRVWPVKKVP